MSAGVMMSDFVVGVELELLASKNVFLSDCLKFHHRGWRSDCCKYWKLRCYGHGCGIWERLESCHVIEGVDRWRLVAW